MAKPGDTYTISLKSSHLKWGEHRNPTNRDIIIGEGYIPIPKEYAVNYSIFNSNHEPNGFGYNLFYADTYDGYFKKIILLAQGCSKAGDIYAKQFSVQGDLRAIGDWYLQNSAVPDNSLKVTWITPEYVMLEIIK